METLAHTGGDPGPRLQLRDFEFDLPAELIAQVPSSTRAASRLLVWDRFGNDLVHSRVADLLRFVQPGEVVVFNDTRVIPARLYGRSASGAGIELLVIRPSAPVEDQPRAWQCLGRPARRLVAGATVRFGDGSGARVVSAPGDGRYEIAFDTDDVAALLESQGELPLPPYIKRPDGVLPLDRERYQTVYATRLGAIAAPTAGLHFTPELLAGLAGAGVEVAYLTLHVGPGTFLPVRTDDLAGHVMDAEWCEISPATAVVINRARRDGRPVIAVGTTTTRALESSVAADGTIVPGERWADRFIVPGHHFRAIDGLFTNFHLPGSTLLALVSAFAGRERMLAVYAEAVRRRYRFYSYGDAMLIR